MEWNAWCLLPIEAFVSGKNHRFHESLLSSSLERIVLESVNRHSGLNVSLSDQRRQTRRGGFSNFCLIK
jgi:hypothetical protein